MMQHLTMADFSRKYGKFYKDFSRPENVGVFLGQLLNSHWVTHRFIHSFWLLENGAKVDCILFPDDNYLDIDSYSIGDFAFLFFSSSNNGNIYLRNITKE